MSRAVLAAVLAAVSLSLALAALYAFVPPETAPSDSGDMTAVEPAEEIPPAVSASNNRFAVDMYRQIAADSDNSGKNILFSPFSMHVAFSLLYEGARTDTASQMEAVFGFEPDDTTRHAHVANAMSYVNRDDQNATLAIANALWLEKLFEPAPGYEDIAHDPYFAQIDTLDFFGAPAESVERINGWVANKTHDRITSVVSVYDITPDLVMIINNAIYFNGAWERPFTLMPDGDFWTHSDRDPIRVDYMSKDLTPYNYTESDGVRVLKLPYWGERFSMLILLPVDAHDTKHLEDTISAENLDRWLSQLESIDVYTYIPKFTIDTNLNLKNYLSDLGMTDVFYPGADLSGIHPQLYVSFARHSAFIDVNEKGTEAAGVTTIGGVIVSERPFVSFEATEPFVFVILDEESRTILFMGRVSNPGL